MFKTGTRCLLILAALMGCSLYQSPNRKCLENDSSCQQLVDRGLVAPLQNSCAKDIDHTFLNKVPLDFLAQMDPQYQLAVDVDLEGESSVLIISPADGTQGHCSFKIKEEIPIEDQVSELLPKAIEFFEITEKL